jgi:hypothetical protein
MLMLNVIQLFDSDVRFYDLTIINYPLIIRFNQVCKYTATDDGPMEPKRVWQGNVNK